MFGREARRALRCFVALLLLVETVPLGPEAHLTAQTAAPVKQAATGRAGMVSSAHPLATQAGLEILAAGGNAFDAAVAIAATLNVVEPMMSGIGGYGTTLTYDAASHRARFLNCSGRIPKRLDPDVFRSPTPNFQENRRGALAISTPGNLNCWRAMSREYGKLEWSRLFDPAIRAAENGHPLNESVAGAIANAFAEFPPHAQAIYGKDGKPLAAGELLVQKDLGRTLRAVAGRGPGIVHGGELGEAIIAEVKSRGGALTLDDLRENQAEWWEPSGIRYRGYEVMTASPPATAFPSLVRLGLMSRLDARKLGHNSVDYLHWFAEITKHSFWTRLRYAGDPDVAPPPLGMLLSEKYWAEQVAQMDAQRARPFVPPAVPASESHTTHFVVADRWGNVVSATQTLGNLFGSRILAPGTGIWLNNSLAYSTFEPKGNPMDAFPGRRKLSGDCPTYVFREGKLWAALGTPGGHTIGQTVPQIVINLIDFKMDIQQAIAAPRVSFAEPDRLLVERAIPETVRQGLAERGHNVVPVGGIGNAHGLTITYDSSGRPSRFAGGADPRGAGLARGY